MCVLCLFTSQDMVGNTALHHALSCGVNVSLTQRLIEHGVHIDISNHAGVTPLSVILKNKNFENLHAFQYMTLKCLAATAIMRFRLQFVGQVPVVLEKEQIHITDNAIVDHLDAYTAPRLVPPSSSR